MALRHPDDAFKSEKYLNMAVKGYRLQDLKDEGYIAQNKE